LVEYFSDSRHCDDTPSPGPVASRFPFGSEPDFGHAGIIVIAPSEQEIRAALEHIVASAKFTHSPTLVAFLRFVVEAALTGRGNRLKSYTIAVEALGRPADFDPGTDAIVRVDAGRIRRALARYYETEGAHDTVAIDLPRGHYAPKFSRGTWSAFAPVTGPDGGASFKPVTPPSGAAAGRRAVPLESLVCNRAAIEAEIISIRAKIDDSHRLVASLESVLATSTPSSLSRPTRHALGPLVSPDGATAEWFLGAANADRQLPALPRFRPIGMPRALRKIPKSC
jgi:hypothetical protein